MKKLIIANWKMNPTTLDQARVLVQSVEHRMHLVKDQVEVVVCPPFLYIPAFSHHTSMATLGAQDMAWESEGAFTGEISPKQLNQWEVEYVILGHSERRIYNGENNLDVRKKIIAALKHKIIPVVCLGGDKEVKKSDFKRLVTKQFNEITKGLKDEQVQKIIFVYEPVWAISTMKNSEPATGEHAAEIIEHIQKLIAKKTSKDKASRMRVLYGGTVNKVNVHEYAKYPIISGALVGSASLNPVNFWGVVQEFARESIHK